MADVERSVVRYGGVLWRTCAFGVVGFCVRTRFWVSGPTVSSGVASMSLEGKSASDNFAVLVASFGPACSLASDLDLFMLGRR